MSRSDMHIVRTYASKLNEEGIAAGKHYGSIFILSSSKASRGRAVSSRVVKYVKHWHIIFGSGINVARATWQSQTTFSSPAYTVLITLVLVL